MKRSKIFRQPAAAAVGSVFLLGNSINVSANPEFMVSKFFRCLVNSVNIDELDCLGFNYEWLLSRTNYLFNCENESFSCATAEETELWCNYYAFKQSNVRALVDDANLNSKRIEEYVQMIENGELGKIADYFAFIKKKKDNHNVNRLEFLFRDLIDAVSKADLKKAIEKYKKTEDFFFEDEKVLFWKKSYF